MWQLQCCIYIIYVQLCMCMYDVQIVKCTVVNVHFCMSMYVLQRVVCVLHLRVQRRWYVVPFNQCVYMIQMLHNY